MTIILNYARKKECKENIGKPLRYSETSMFGEEYVRNGRIAGCNRPHITGFKREWFGTVTMKDGLIAKVE